MDISVPSLVILVSAVLVLSCMQTDGQNHRRWSNGTTVGVSNNSQTSKAS